ncbi:RNA recognition motif domain-containing protein [Thalassotalea fusca]
MNSSQLLTIIVGVVCAIVAFFVASQVQLTPVMVAAIAFLSAVISPLFANRSPNEGNNDNGDIKTLYVGNLPYRANEGAVRELFSAYGNVHSVRLMKDKNTGKRRGFGFVEMAASDVDNAIDKLNDSEFQQRTLKVREAKERPEKNDDQE